MINELVPEMTGLGIPNRSGNNDEIRGGYFTEYESLFLGFVHIKADY